MESIPVTYRIDITFGCGKRHGGDYIFTSQREVAMEAIKNMSVFFFESCSITDTTVHRKDGEDVAKVLTVYSGPIINGEDVDTMNRKIAELGAMIKRKLKQDKIAIGIAQYSSTVA